MKICYAVLHYDPAYREPHRYLELVPIHREIPREMARLGHQVEVVHLFPEESEFVEEGVLYRFVRSGAAARLLSRIAGRILGRDPAFYEPALEAVRAVGESHADLIHFHSVNLHWNLALLFRALGPTPAPVLLHYHGGYPARNALTRRVQRLNFRRAARLLFTTGTHAQPFLEAGILQSTGQVAELMETSSNFRPRSRLEARRETGMAGDPVFLWVGRLHPLKDPLTALRGFERIAAAWPRAQLYFHYLTEEMLPELQAFVASSPALAGRVHFRGRVPFDRMEALYNSADFLLQASHREVCGGAVLEAMACGVIPVVSDIPSFRAVTDGGRHGILFRRGNDEELAWSTLAIDRAEIPHLSAGVRNHFERALSFPAMARRLEGIYREIVQEKLPRH